MKHLRIFNSEEEYNTYKNSDQFVTPNVSYVVNTHKVFYNVEIFNVNVLRKHELIPGNNGEIPGINMVDLGLPSGRLWGDKKIGEGTNSTAISSIPWFTRWGETDWYDISFERLTGQQIYDLIYECTQNNLCSMYKLLYGITEEELHDILGEDDIKELIKSTTELYTEQVKIMSVGGMFDEDYFNDSGSIMLINTKDIYNYFDATTDSETGIIHFNKYNIENKMVLDLEDDAINANFSNYRIPTEADFLELFNNTTIYCVDKNNNEYDLECFHSLDGFDFYYLHFKNPDDADVVLNNGLKLIKFVGNNGNVLKFKTDYIITPFDEPDESDFSISCLSIIYGASKSESITKDLNHCLVPTSNLYLTYDEDENETPSSKSSVFLFWYNIGGFAGWDRLEQFNVIPVSI